MSDERSTTWKQRGDHSWRRWTSDGANPMRLGVFEYRGEWIADVTMERSLGNSFVLYDTDTDPDCPPLTTCAAAQAAAEQWVRDFAAGLIAAMGTKEAP